MWWSSLFENMRPSDFFNFSFFPKYGTAFVRGIEYTLLLAVVSVLLAVVPALLLALMRLSKNKPIKWLAGAYIAVFRSTPMLVQLSIIYYGLFYAISLPRITLFGFVDISRFIPGVVALALNSSAYVAEIFRAGILAVDKGQVTVRDARLHAVGQQQGVHPGFAFQQFGHGVFAPYQGGILLRRGLVCLGLGGLLGHAFFIFHLQCGYSLKRLGKALCGGVWQPFCRVWQPAQLSGMIR